MPGGTGTPEKPRRSFEPPVGGGVLNTKVLSSKVLNSKALGSKVLNSQALSSKVLNSKALGSKIGAVDGPEPIRTESIKAVHQLVPMLVPGDATSDHAIQLRRLAHGMGLESEIFATAIHDDLRDESFLVHELPDRRLPGTLLVYQMSSASEMVHLARERLEPLAVNYHNVTPAWAYEHWQPAIAADQRWARRQLSFLADRASLAICDSSYNARELDAAGYRNTVVCPVLVDMERLSSAHGSQAYPSADSSGPELPQTPLGDRANWLFVGRIAPHKAQHKLVEALASYVKLYDDRVHLDLIGRPGSYRYAQAVRRLAQKLGVSELVNIEGDLDGASLGDYYRRATVFVSASVHEGFCVPIVEAMHHGVPVVALAEAAVPETVGSAGLLVESSDPALLAAAVHSVLCDKSLRELLAARGAQRASELSLTNSRATMRRVLERWVDARGCLDVSQNLQSL
jgi:glycosyltransferase involved in cell wall biosynthesis